MRKPKIGIALGSGGARGWCHIGVLRTLAENGIEPDVVAGCSIGALVGAAYAAGELDELEEWARALTWRGMASFLDVSLARGGLIEGRRIMTILRSFRDNVPIESLGKPFTAIASDLLTGREVWLQNGSVADAVRASIGLPGILSPVKIDGKWLLDGGMTNPVPVSACRAMGAEVIVAVNANAHVLEPNSRRVLAKPVRTESTTLSLDIWDKLLESVPAGLKQSFKKITPRFLDSQNEAPGYFDVLSTAIDIMTSQIMRSRLAGEPPDVMINPRLNHLSVLELYRAEEAIEEGRQSAKRVLHLLRDYLG